MVKHLSPKTKSHALSWSALLLNLLSLDYLSASCETFKPHVPASVEPSVHLHPCFIGVQAGRDGTPLRGVLSAPVPKNGPFYEVYVNFSASQSHLSSIYNWIKCTWQGQNFLTEDRSGNVYKPSGFALCQRDFFPVYRGRIEGKPFLYLGASMIHKLIVNNESYLELFDVSLDTHWKTGFTSMPGISASTSFMWTCFQTKHPRSTHCPWLSNMHISAQFDFNAFAHCFLNSQSCSSKALSYFQLNLSPHVRFQTLQYERSGANQGYRFERSTPLPALEIEFYLTAFDKLAVNVVIKRLCVLNNDSKGATGVTCTVLYRNTDHSRRPKTSFLRSLATQANLTSQLAMERMAKVYPEAALDLSSVLLWKCCRPPVYDRALEAQNDGDGVYSYTRDELYARNGYAGVYNVLYARNGDAGVYLHARDVMEWDDSATRVPEDDAGSLWDDWSTPSEIDSTERACSLAENFDTIG